MSALDDLISGKGTSAPTAVSSPSPTATAAPPSPMTGPVESSDYQSAGGQTPNPAPIQSTQNFNGQQIPSGINTKNLVNYDSSTGNKTFKLPDFAGGGVYTEDANNNLINQGHGNYGGESQVAGQERDDIIPVSLGGTNSDPNNIKDVPMSVADPQDKQETAMAKAVRTGQIAPHAAIAQILSQKAQIAGQEPTPGMWANMISAIEDLPGQMLTKTAEPILQGIERTGTKAVDIANATQDLIQSGGKPSMKATQDLNAPGDYGTNFFTRQSEKVNPNPDTIAGNLQSGADIVNPAAMAIGLEGGLADTGGTLETQTPSKTPLSEPQEPPTSGGSITTDDIPTSSSKQPASLKDVTPDYNNKMNASDKMTNAKGETQYRVNPPKTGGSTTINPNASEFASAQEVDKIPDYSKAKNFTTKAQSVDTAISNEAENMRGSIKVEDKVDPLDIKTEQAKMQKSTYDALPEDMKAKVDAGKPLPNTKAGQYYQTTLDNADSYNGTREGKLDVRQSNDTAYQSARGKYAFGDENLNSLDDSNNKLRGDLNKDLNNTTKNSDVKTSLKKQTDLYNARDVLNDKAKGETTFAKRHPLLNKIGTREITSATAGGIAGAIAGGSFTSLGGKVKNAIGGEINKLRGVTPQPKATKPKAPPKLKL